MRSTRWWTGPSWRWRCGRPTTRASSSSSTASRRRGWRSCRSTARGRGGRSRTRVACGRGRTWTCRRTGWWSGSSSGACGAGPRWVYISGASGSPRCDPCRRSPCPPPLAPSSASGPTPSKPQWRTPRACSRCAPPWPYPRTCGPPLRGSWACGTEWRRWRCTWTRRRSRARNRCCSRSRGRGSACCWPRRPPRTLRSRTTSWPTPRWRPARRRARGSRCWWGRRWWCRRTPTWVC
mmetsp:Transcript_16446/g.52349  ORF Transcript_16446/g.52349 Transcript_16446/m.52349 type:complete len:236 (+) Transcript_16446:1520-2227(+)